MLLNDSEGAISLCRGKYQLELRSLVPKAIHKKNFFTAKKKFFGRNIMKHLCDYNQGGKVSFCAIVIVL